MKYWLMKSEPTTYSIDDLEREGVSHWEGVRNYQARNFMMNEMEVGDLALFYHSNATPPGVVGVCRIHSKPYPDHTAFDKKSNYFDPKSTKEKPRWFMVDVSYVKTYPRPIPLSELREQKELEGMVLLQKGSRLSIQPVSKEHFSFIENLGK
jgi:predicted RNA-binding protein with PUA-like domain